MSTPANPLAGVTPEQLAAIVAVIQAQQAAVAAPPPTPWYKSPTFWHGFLTVGLAVAGMFVKNPQSQQKLGQVKDTIGAIVP